MNNKKIGSKFEKEFCEELTKQGYWVHFITPDITGAQPFDVIAVSHEKTFAFDCKTSSKREFPFTRLEDNQVMAFEKWLRCANKNACIAVKYKGHIYIIPYETLRDKKKVVIDEDDTVYCWK